MHVDCNLWSSLHHPPLCVPGSLSPPFCSYKELTIALKIGLSYGIEIPSTNSGLPKMPALKKSRTLRLNGKLYLSNRDGLVPDENERYGGPEVCPAAKRSRVWNSSRVANVKDKQPATGCVFLALAPPAGGMSGARDGEAGSGDSSGDNAIETGRPQQEESTWEPVLWLRRSQNIRRSPVPPLLAYLRKTICLTI